MTEEHKGWKIFYGMYGTTREILDRTHKYWADVCQNEDWCAYPVHPVGNHFETRADALQAAKQRIDELTNDN